MINWKLRLRNKATLTALVGILVAAVYQALGLLGIQTPIGQETVTQIVGLLITALAAFGIVVDPTTAGVADSDEAMERDVPKPQAGAEENED